MGHKKKGLLTKKHLNRIYSLIDDASGIGGGSVPIIGYMRKGKDIIFYNRIDKELYYCTNGDLEKCYKIQTKDEFIKVREDLIKKRWKVL